VLIHAPPGLIELARQAGLSNISQVNADDGRGKGTAAYAVDLSR
jgi:2',3'-cyclic-nucleotide 2'-phosphodiesterase/3'-nucleotidase